MSVLSVELLSSNSCVCAYVCVIKIGNLFFFFFFFQAEDGIRDLVRSRGLGDVYKRQDQGQPEILQCQACYHRHAKDLEARPQDLPQGKGYPASEERPRGLHCEHFTGYYDRPQGLSLIHI